jgi:hypothetical protein
MSAKQLAVGEAFANAVCQEQWEDIYPLLSDSARAGLTAKAVEKQLVKQFSWGKLLPALKKAWNQETDEDVDDFDLDPPALYEVYESEGRHEYSPKPVFQTGLTQPTAKQKAAWLQIEFLPDEDSEYDQCYRCYLCMINDAGQDKIAGYIVEPITD